MKRRLEEEKYEKEISSKKYQRELAEQVEREIQKVKIESERQKIGQQVAALERASQASKRIKQTETFDNRRGEDLMNQLSSLVMRQ